jgi:hypothetical protein
MIAVLAAAFAVACHSDINDEPAHHNVQRPALILDISGAVLGVETRAEDMTDSEREFAIEHLDVMIFNDAATDEDKSLFYHERVVAAGPEGKVGLGVNVDAIVAGAKYWVYVVANSTADASTFGSIDNVKNLLGLSQTDYNLHLTATGLANTPSFFLMDGVAYMGATEPTTPAAITITEGQITDVVTLKVTMRRAAAKIVVKLMSAEDMEFSNSIVDSTPGYYMRNLPYETRVINDGVLRQVESLETTHETLSEYYKWIHDEENRIIGVEITTYVYSHMWDTEDSFSHATNLLVDIPAYYTTTKDGVETTLPHPKNYYQVPLTREFKFERNHYYEVVANVHAPGAEDFSEPVDISDIKYSAEPWTERLINIGGELGPEYLKVNLDFLKIYNTDIDAESLLFTSSSPVTITIEDCYYIDKFGTKRNISANNYNISGSTQPGALSGNITVKSKVPTNNTIRYFTLRVVNETGQVEYVDVEQYPLVYIVNILGHYSYRDDFKSGSNAPTTIYNIGSSYSSISLNRWNSASGTWSYNYSNSVGGFWSSKVVIDTYSTTDSRDAYRGRSDIDYYRWRYNYLNYSGAQDPGNARMYHVRITATSGDYNLGVPRKTTDPNVDFEFTDPGDDNANLVSPSFMIASRLGFVNSNGLSSADNQEKRLAVSRDHCANYVEVANDGTVYDDWRLPTASELQIIIDLQGTSHQSADAIDYLLNANYYYSASGPVFNEKNDSGSKEHNASKSSWAIRCIRDAY